MPVTTKSFVNRTDDDCFGIILDLKSSAGITGLDSDRFRSFEYDNAGPGPDKNYCSWQWPVSATPCNPQDPQSDHASRWIPHGESVQVTVIHTLGLDIKGCEWLGDRLKKKAARILDIQVAIVREADAADGKLRFKCTLSNPQTGSIVVVNPEFRCYEYFGPSDNPDDPEAVAQRLAPVSGPLPAVLQATGQYADVAAQMGAVWSGGQNRGVIPNNGTLTFSRDYLRINQVHTTYAVVWGQVAPIVFGSTDTYFALVWRIAP